MSGIVGDLSNEQEEKLIQFRKAIRDVMRPDYDDYFLLRWLRARKFDVQAAEIMLRECLNWRQYMEVDTILDFKFPDIVLKYIPGSLVGHDKEGNPVWIIPYKDLDLKGWLATNNLRSLLMKYLIYCVEEAVKDMKIQSKKLGTEIERMVVIHDLEGISIRQMPWRATLKFIEEYFKIDEANYPERLKTAYIINYEDWKSELLKEIDPSELPKHWGGTKVDPDGDEKCPSIVRFGGKLPAKHYKMSISEYLSAHSECKTSVIAKSTIWGVNVIVEETGSVLEWNFMTENRDIAFGVYFKGNNYSKMNGERDYYNSKEEEVPLIPIKRVQSHLVPEIGAFKCDRNGTYVFKFDNSYSWYYSKKLHYSISVVPPTTEIN